MKSIAITAIASSILLTTGCISKRTGGSAFNEREWTQGVTMKRDVVSAWGNPDSIDGDVWIWRETRHIGGKIKASFYGIGATVSRTNTATYEHRLRFDKDGRLVSRESTPSIPDGEKWSINPW